jgi:hypothetical protein
MDGRTLLALALIGACGGSDGGGGGDDTGPDAPMGTGWEVSYGRPAAVFAEVMGGPIYRWADLDGDGDFNEAGERTLFATSTGTYFGPLLAIDASTLLVIENPSGGGSVKLSLIRDGNSDGDAVDAGESRVVFSGILPGGAMMPSIGGMTRAKDGSLYVVEQGGSTAGQRIYRLADGNNDGDMDDPGEAAQFTVGPMDFNVVGLAVDKYGELWFAVTGGPTASGADFYRVRNGTPTLIVERAALKAARDLSATARNFVALADGSIGFAAITGPPRQPVFVALRDEDGDHEIALSEAKVIWDMQNGDFWWGDADAQVLDDGSIVAVNAHRVLRLVDGDANRDFLDVGETHVVYDEFFALANGQVAQDNLLDPYRVTGAILP